jgi:hypothetical protein
VILLLEQKDVVVFEYMMGRRYTKLTGKGGSMPSSSSSKKRLG